MNSVWVRNTKGVEVEVREDQLSSLLSKGFKLLEESDIKTIKPRTPIDADLPGQSQYPYGGYGRVVELLEECFQFNPESKNKIYVGYPRPIEKQEGEKIFFITAFEGKPLPEFFIPILNGYDVVIVPSEWCRKLFVDAGVTSPVEVMIQGANNFDLIEKAPTRPPFRFLHYNSFSEHKRKGWDLVVLAFIGVFGDDPDYELVLKGRTHDNDKDIASIPKQPNIKIITKNMKRYEMDAMLETIHCMVFPSRGEGLGIPPIETMARGIPTIVANNSGMTEYSKLGIRVVSNDSIEAVYDFDWQGGTWSNPSLDDLKKKMLQVSENYGLFKDLAIKNSVEIKKRYSIEAQTQRFLEIIARHAV